ncbi:MAG: ABC transporter ATP-binding protein [Armatimonadota bacterium]|nr:ABC transporter ATP-binding protein [Armatimonadota bacterium]
MPADAAVEARGLTKRFDDFVAVDHVDLTIARGEIFGFLGPNGSGKTTTIRMLGGLLLPSEGSVCVLGCDVVAEPETVKARIGYMNQRSSLYNDMTAVELLHFYGQIYGLDGRRRRQAVDAWLDRTGLADRGRDLIGTLSGGWRQRLALGCAVLHHPELLLLDEPTSGTDPVQRREFWELIYRFADEGTTVLVTTHYMDEAEHCATLAFIHAGRIIAQGTPSSLKATAMRGGVLEVVADPWMRAMNLLRRFPEAREAALYGVAIHVVVDDPATAVGRVARYLQEGGVTVHRVEPRAPSLEDVFVSLVEPQARTEVRAAFGGEAVKGAGGELPRG